MHTPIRDIGVCRINQTGAILKELEVTQENILDYFYEFLKFDFPFNFSTISEWEKTTGISLSLWEKEQMLLMKLTLDKQKPLSTEPNCIDPLATPEEKKTTLNDNFIAALKGANNG